jgi:hypothetical protein
MEIIPPLQNRRLDGPGDGGLHISRPHQLRMPPALSFQVHEQSDAGQGSRRYRVHELSSYLYELSLYSKSSTLSYRCERWGGCESATVRGAQDCIIAEVLPLRRGWLRALFPIPYILFTERVKIKGYFMIFSMNLDERRNVFIT